MSDDNHELSDEEYDALLSDLEGRASTGGAGAETDAGDAGEDLGDIDDFLAGLEEGDDAKSSTKTADADDDDLAREFAALEEKGELTAAPKGGSEAAKSKKKKPVKSDKKDGGEKEGGQEGAKKASRGRKIALGALKAVLWFTPALVLLWLLGAYLGQWISAGWLVAIVAASFVFAVPLALKRWTKRGTYRPWLLGTSVVVTAALVAPMPQVAGENMTSYGHWPASTVAEISGADVDAAFVRSTASVAGSIAGLITTGETTGWQARQLGTAFPLGMQWPQEELVPLLEEAGEAELEELQEAIEEIGDNDGA